MINVGEAICAETAVKAKMQVPIEGYRDENNHWVDGGFTPPFTVLITPVPIGDNASGTHGQSLKAEAIGERVPAMMKFHCRLEMPMNAMILVEGLDFKVTRRGDYNGGGYWSAVGMTVQDYSPTIVTDPLILDSITLRQGAKSIPVSRLIKATR